MQNVCKPKAKQKSLSVEQIKRLVYIYEADNIKRPEKSLRGHF
jgi:hypothetical protein